MSDDKIRILIETEVSKALKNLKDLEKQAKDTAQKSGTFMDGFKESLKKLEGPTSESAKSFGKMAGIAGAVVAGFVAIGVAVVAAYRTIEKFVDVAADQQKSMNKLEAVSRSVGVSFGETQKAAADLSKDGLITFQESANAISNLLASGLNLKEATDLLRAHKDMAIVSRQANYKLGESLVVFTEGVKNQNSLNTDATGASKNYAAVLEEQAKAHGLVASKLTKEQEAHLIAIGFTKEAAAFKGEAAKASGTYAGQTAQLESSITKFSATLGSVFMPMLARINGAMAESVAVAGKMIEQLFNTENPNDIKNLDSLQAQLATVKTIIAEAKARNIPESVLKDLAQQQLDISERIRTIKLSNAGDKEKLQLMQEQLSTLYGQMNVQLKMQEDAKASKDKKEDVRAGNEASRLATLIELQKREIAALEKRIQNLPVPKKQEVPGLTPEELKKINDEKLAYEEKYAQASLAIVEDKYEQEREKENLRLKKALEDIKALRESSAESDKRRENEATLHGEIMEKIRQKEVADWAELAKKASEAGIAADEFMTLGTKKNVEKRIEEKKKEAETIKQILASGAQVAQKLMDFGVQLAKQEADAKIAEINRVRDEQDKAAQAQAKQESDSIRDFQRQHDDAARAEADATLAKQRADLEAKIASEEEGTTKTADLAQLASVKKQQADAAYQAKLLELQDAKDKADQKRADEKEARDKEAAAKTKKINHDAFEMERGMKMASATMSGAVAAISMFASPAAIATLGVAAVPVAASLAAMTATEVALIASQANPYRTGISYIPADQLAYLHEGERVLTKEENRSYQSTNMGGITIHMHAVNDPETFSRELDAYMKRYGGLPT